MKLLYLAVALLLLMSACTIEESKTIGVLVPLTGDAAAYGNAILQGIELHIDNTNYLGGIDGRHIELVVEDSECDAAAGLQGAAKLVLQDEVDAIIGAVCSTASLGAVGITEEHDVLQISPVSSAPSITQTHIFRLYPSDVYQAQIASENLWNDGHRSLAIIHVDDDYGAALAEAIALFWEEKGGRILLKEQIASEDTNYQTQAMKSIETGADAIYVIGLLEQTARVLNELYLLENDAPVYGVESLKDDQLLLLAPEAVEQLTFFTAVDYNGPEADLFIEQYKQTYNSEPPLYANYGYDSARVLVEAFKHTDGSYEQLTAHLKSYQMIGATGEISFDVNGDIQRPFTQYVVENGAFIELD